MPISWPGWATAAWHEGVGSPESTGYEHYWFGSLANEMRDASGQMYMRNRYYDPQSGQFTQMDPIGLAGGMNAYGFAAGDPVSYSDPYGLSAEDCDPPGSCRGADAGQLSLQLHLNRNRDNINLPPTRAEAEAQQWSVRPQSENVFHRYGTGNEGNVKYMSRDGEREAVYNSDGELVTDPTNYGTYNYGTNPVSHMLIDVAPYLFVGNGEGDRTTAGQRMGTFVRAARDRVGGARPAAGSTTQEQRRLTEERASNRFYE